MTDRETPGPNKVHLSKNSLEALAAQILASAGLADDADEEPVPVYEMPYAWRAAAGWL